MARKKTPPPKSSTTSPRSTRKAGATPEHGARHQRPCDHRRKDAGCKTLGRRLREFLEIAAEAGRLVPLDGDGRRIAGCAVVQRRGEGRVDHRAAIGLGAAAQVNVLDMEEIALVEPAEPVEAVPRRCTSARR